VNDELRDFLITQLKGAKNVLDVGCGDKSCTYIASSLGCSVYTIDAWLKHLPSLVLDLEVERLSKYLPENSFDVVLVLDLVEHLEKRSGFDLIEDAKRICKKKVILLTPLKWSPNTKCFNDKKSVYYQNPYVLHKSLWEEKDFPDFEKIELNFTNPKLSRKGGYFLAIFTKC
jgi:cyclopropane fatty-acyl-phospholipid synthase-like methyltransferase